MRSLTAKERSQAAQASFSDENVTRTAEKVVDELLSGFKA